MKKKDLAALSAEDLAAYAVAAGILRLLKEEIFMACGHRSGAQQGVESFHRCRCVFVDVCKRTSLDKDERKVKNFVNEYRSRKNIFTREMVP